MALFLVQHGLSLSKEIDPEKGLSEKGKEENQRIGDVAKHYAIHVDRIVHSGKKRAEQTAVAFQKSLIVETEIEKVSELEPLGDVRAFVENLNAEENLMVIGHLPFMERLVSYLITGSEDILVYRFQNSGIVCLDQEDNNWYITWTLNPNIG